MQRSQQRTQPVATLKMPPSTPMRVQTGYASNNRPVLQYNADVDDDQGLRDLCDPKLHFATRTQRDYDPMRRSIEDKTEAAMHPKTWGTDGAAYAASKYASSRAARTQSSGFQVQFSHTLPKSKEVDPPQALSTETRSTYRAVPAQTDRGVPIISRSGASVHPARDSAFTRNLQDNAFEPTQERPSGKTETKTQFEPRAQAECAQNKHQFHLPPIVKQPSQYEYGNRVRPCFLPPKSDQVYGEASRTAASTTARLARSDPTEHFNRTSIRSNVTWTQANYGDKHTEAMDQGRKLLETNRHLLQNTRSKPSGFATNVDVFRVEPDDEKERFQTTTRNNFARK